MAPGFDPVAYPEARRLMSSLVGTLCLPRGAVP